MVKNLTFRIEIGLAHPSFKKYFTNTSWLFTEQLLRLIAGLIVGVYVARYLGPERFGLFSYALAFVALFASISKLGMDGIIVKSLVIAPSLRDVYLGTAFWLRILGAVLAGAGIALALRMTERDATTALYIGIIASGLIFQSFEVIEFYFQSRVLSKYVSICKISQLAISSLLKLVFVATNMDLFWFVVLSLIDQASLAATLAFAYSNQRQGAFYGCFDGKIAKEFLLTAKPYIISGIMVAVYSSVDRIVVKEMLGVREVGLYVAASGFVTALYFLPYMIANSLFPELLNSKSKSANTYTKTMSLMYRCSVSLGLVISVIVTVFASSIIELLYGPSFADSSSVLQIYIWNFVLISFSAVFGKWLLAENLQKILPRLTFMAVTLNVLGNFLLIPLWSIEGAAIAALASQFIPVLWFSLTSNSMKSQLRCILKSSH